MFNEFVQRSDLYGAIKESLNLWPVTALLGPRQCGKTSMAKLFAQHFTHHFDLENPLDITRLEPNSFGILSGLQGVIVIDEIQQKPELFDYLRVIVDSPNCRARFLLTGSASPSLTSHASNSLAGRIHFIRAGGFDLAEVGPPRLNHLWLRGGFPRSFLAANDTDSDTWRQDYLSTYVMRDIAQLAGGNLSPTTLAKLLELIAHYHGQFWNAQEAASILGVNIRTINRYLNILEEAFLIRMVSPYAENTSKRIRKAQRLYLRDSGVFHTLARIPNLDVLRSHPRLGASWEGFAIEQVTSLLKIGGPNAYFWRTHAGAEIDLVVPTTSGPVGMEFKASLTPTITRGTHDAMVDLGIKKLCVIYPGDQEFEFSNGIRALPLARLDRLRSMFDPEAAPTSNS